MVHIEEGSTYLGHYIEHSYMVTWITNKHCLFSDNIYPQHSLGLMLIVQASMYIVPYDTVTKGEI